MVTTSDYISSMKTVGVKELKARLSAYLRAVKRGETVIVTEHERVIAELHAPRTDRNSAEDIAESLDRLAAAGEVSRATSRKRGWRWKPAGLGLRPGAAARILSDLRDEPVRAVHPERNERAQGKLRK